jgi:hypothetical protein
MEVWCVAPRKNGEVMRRDVETGECRGVMGRETIAKS